VFPEASFMSGKTSAPPEPKSWSALDSLTVLCMVK